MKPRRRKSISKHAEEKEAWSGGYSVFALYSDLILLGVFVVLAAIILLFVPILRNQSTTWIIFAVAAIVCSAVLAAVFFYRRYSRWYVVTNERLIHREGIFLRRHHILELIRVDDVTFEQGPIESLLGCGTIFVSSSDTSHPELEISGIQDVEEIAELIDSLRRKERKTRGLHVEAI